MTDLIDRIPTSWRGRDGKKDYEDVISGKYDKKSETKPFEKKPDTNDFVYVPSINLYVAKEKIHLNKNWKDCWTELKNQNYQMLKINEFREFLKYTKENHKDIYNEITEVNSPWRGEWLDANFKVEKNELYLLTENESKKEKLEDCLMKDKNPGIDLNDWINGKNISSQGLPNKKVSSGSLYYWHPRSDNNSVARFGAYDGRTLLGCCRDPSYADSGLGVRAVKEK